MDDRPYIPNIERRIQFIIDALIDPCDAPITVYFKLFWPAFRRLVLQWYITDLKQVFTSWLRPALFAVEGRSKRHWGGGKKNKRGWFWRRIGTVVSFDLGEFIGKHLWGGEEIRSRALPPGAGYLWILEGIIQRLLFYMMVLDLLTEFLYAWGSSVMATAYCQARDDAVFTGKCGPYPLLGIFGWDAQGAYTPLKMRNIAFFNGFGVMQTVGPGRVGASAAVRRNPDDPEAGWVKLRLRCLEGPSKDQEVQMDYEPPGMDPMETGVGASCQKGDIWIFEIAVDGRWIMDQSYLWMHAASPNPP